MFHSRSFAWILVSLLSLALSAPLQADITPDGDVDPVLPDYLWWWTGGGGSSTSAYIGKTAAGSVTVNLGSDLSSYSVHIGYEAGATGVVTVDGSGSTWTNSIDLSVGCSGQGTLDITGGGVVSNGTGFIGDVSGSDGEVTVDGDGSTWTNGYHLYVGRYGQGTLNITNGGAVSDSVGYIGLLPDSTGGVIVDGIGSTWTSRLTFYVGRSGQGTLDITNGGAVSNADEGYIGRYSGSTGVVTVDGGGSTWTNSSNLYVGGGSTAPGGTGELTLSNGGSVEVGETLKVWGGGTVNLTDGTLTADSIDHTDGGAFNFTGGWLNVGTFIGEVVNGGGTLAPGTSPGTTNIQGNYTQAAGAAMEIEIGGLSAGTDHDQVVMTGGATLAGTLDLSIIDEYVPDFYDEFVIVTAGTLNGTFDTITGYSVSPGMSLAVVYNANNVTVVAAIPGDADLDTDVNLADLQILSDNWGSGVTWGTADFNGNGNVDLADLQILSDNWGSGTIPEPATLSLLILGGLALIRRNARTRTV